MHDLLIKRAYEEVDLKDGYRILIDRLWPRGISKDRARLDNWAKSISPSTELRKAFNHVEDNMKDFRKRYIDELNQNLAATDFVALVTEKLKQCNVTLLYGAKDGKCNNAVVLMEWLEEIV